MRFTPQRFAERFDLPSQTALDNAVGALHTDMARIIEVQARLGARPHEKITPRQARRMKTLCDAEAEILALHGDPGEADDLVLEDETYESEGQTLALRIFRPKRRTGRGPMPIILYFPDTLWIGGDLARFDAIPKLLARRCSAIVVSAETRAAPEHRFPAAHDDAWAVWLWLNARLHALSGDFRRIGLCGEGSGANLALNVALRTGAEHRRRPIHLALITPMALTGQRQALAQSRPLSGAGVVWAERHLIETPDQTSDPRLDLIDRSDLAALPPTTIILADADPLRPEGEALGDAIEAAGVDIETTLYGGVTHGFFVLGRSVNMAIFANSQVTTAFNAAFLMARSPAG